MRRLRTWVVNLGLALLSLAVFCAALEFSARRLVSHWRKTRVFTPHGSVSRYHPILGWDKPPGLRVRLRRPEYEVDLEINSRGLRGPEREHAKPAGTRRVLMLGDSFVEGYCVPEHRSARAVLETLLNVGACGRVEVLNGGTAAWSTDQELLFFDLEGRKYAPDVVTLFFFYNDLAANTSDFANGRPKPYFELESGELVLRGTPLPAPPEAERISRHEPMPFRLKPWRESYALRLLSDRTVEGAPELHRLLARWKIVEPRPVTPPPVDMLAFAPGRDPSVEAAWERTAALLRALQGAVGKQGARLLLVYVPARFEVDERAWTLTRQQFRLGRRWDHGRVFDRLARVAADLRVELLDPRPPLREAQARGPAYFPRDGHWTAVGQEAAARAIVEATRRALGCDSP
jgi:hypothetical protein